MMIEPSKGLGVAILALCVNIVLMLIKIATGILGNSYALIADGIESAGDIFVSLITWAGFYLSLRPADENHPFGHGKYESLAGVFSGASLLFAAGLIAVQSAKEILAPHQGPEWFTLPILIGVVVAKEFLSRKIMALGKDLDSGALQGDAWHHRSDAITSAAAAVGISIALIGGVDYAAADDWAALFACAVIVYNGGRIIRFSLRDVLDERVESELVEFVRQRAKEVKGVKEIDKCRMRKSGIGYFVEIHIQVDGGMTVTEGHRISHQVKDHLMESNVSLIDVVVHLEPVAMGRRID